MKKILLLTGICILSACGGGGGSTPISGGATAGKPAEGRPNINEDSFPRETRISNSQVTSMLSQIFIPKGNVGDGYNMYTLQDVKFISSEDTPTDEDYITFGVNDKTGVIENLIIHDDTDTITMERDRDNIFNIPGYKYQIAYMSNGEPKVWTSKIFLTKITDKAALRDEIIGQMTDENIPADKKDAILANFDKGEWGSYLLTSTFQYVSKNGLQYSDFGYNTTKVSDGQLFDYDVVAGGYTIYQIPADKIASQSLTFTGKAVGTISYTNTEGKQISEISTDNNATKLVFDNGKETLTMPFNEYYTVTVEKDGNTSNIKFTDWKGTDSKFKFTNETATPDNAWIMYYGKDNNPSEAVGTIEHSEDSANRPTFDAGFGAQVTQ